MEVKIVGFVTDEDTLEEIQNIAKVFVYEQHMKRFTLPFRSEHSPQRQHIPSRRRVSPDFNYQIHHILVKGLS